VNAWSTSWDPAARPAAGSLAATCAIPTGPVATTFGFACARGADLGLDDVGDPSAGTPFTLCISASHEAEYFHEYALAYELALPVGAGWTPMPDGWSYKDRGAGETFRSISIRALAIDFHARGACARASRTKRLVSILRTPPSSAA
jgi:hypothetical protein